MHTDFTNAFGLGNHCHTQKNENQDKNQKKQ